MARIELISAAYSGRSIIASGQECVNLFAEVNQQDPQAPAQVTYYPTPGTELYANPNFARPVRGQYNTSIGSAYCVVGPNLYYLLSNQTLVQIGVIADRLSQVYMIDNGITLVIVDGVNGYVVDLATNAFSQITDPNFYGADFVVLLDTFYIFNIPETNQFFISISNADFALLSTVGAFDPLDIAAKSGFNDPIVGIATAHNELWLIGNRTTEVWIGTGAADFYFQRQQGAYINHGCAAPYSIATMDILVFYIMQDQQGSGIVVQGQGYGLTEISTPRIVEEFKSYITLADAIGFCFQIGDHAFYALIFPTANKGWLYEVKTKQWSEWNWCDNDGNLLRPRANCYMYAYGELIVGDWENGKLWRLSLSVLTDDTQPIVRIRTFPHQVDNNVKISYSSFQADMEVGTTTDQETEPFVGLSWSDNKGKTYGNIVEQSLGHTGDYLTSPAWNRLGQARDRVFKLQWSASVVTALNGGFIERKKAAR